MSDSPEIPAVTMTSTKKEMLQAYERLLKQLEEKKKAEMKPDETVAQRKRAQAVAVADAASSAGIANQIASLKTEIGKALNELSDRLEQETAKYVQVKLAVESAESELREIYDIEKAAASLAALLEAHKLEKQEFEAEMAAEREKLDSEISIHREAFDYEVKTQRDEWKKEKAEYQASVKEQEETEKKRRQRDQEEWKYQFDRERQAAEEKRQHELARLDREIQLKQEHLEKVLADRELALAAAEAELQSLRARAEQFPGELEQAVSRAVAETTARLERERKYATDLLQKESAGERNVLVSRIESMEQTIEKQAEQIAKLSRQLEHSYGQIQDIAVKAIEGPSTSRSGSQATGLSLPTRMPGGLQNE